MKKKSTPNSYQRVLQRARGGLLTKFKSRKGGKKKSPSSSPVTTPLSSSTTANNKKNKSGTTKPTIATKTEDVAVPSENDMNMNNMPCSPRSITTYETQKIDNTAKKSTTKASSPSFPSVIEEEEMSEGLLSTEYTFETATAFTALTANTNETTPGENLLPELDNACWGLLFATDKKAALTQAVEDINESGKSLISTVVDDFNKGSGYLLSTVNTAHTQTTTTNLDVVVEDEPEPESLWSKLVTNVNNIAGITTNNDQSTVMDQSTIQTDLTTEYSYGVDSLTTGTMSTNDDGSHTIDSLISDEKKKEETTALQNEWMDNKRVASSSSPTPSTSSSQKKMMKLPTVILKKVRSTSPKLFAKKIVKNTSNEEEGSKSPSTTTATELGSIVTEKGSMAASKSSKNSTSSSKKKINKSRTTSRTPSPLTMLRARSMAKKNTASDVVVVDAESVYEAASSNVSPTIAVEEGSVQKPQEQDEKKDTAEISKDNETKSITKSARLSPVNVMDFDNTDEVEVLVLDEVCEVKEDTLVKSSSLLNEDNEKVGTVGKESSLVVEEKEQRKDQQEDSMLQTISVEANEIMNQVNDILKVEEIAGQ